MRTCDARPAARPPCGQPKPDDPRVRLELPSSCVRALMERGALRVEGMRCLDGDTKRIIRRLCLECCATPEAGQPEHHAGTTGPVPR